MTLDIARRMNPRPSSTLLHRKEDTATAKIWLESIADDATSLSSELKHSALRSLESEGSLQFITNDSAISSNTDMSAADAKKQMQDSGFDSTHNRASLSLSCGQDDGALAILDMEEEGDCGEVVWASTNYVDWINAIMTDNR